MFILREISEAIWLFLETEKSPAFKKTGRKVSIGSNAEKS